MGSMNVVAHNLSSMFSNRQLGITTGKKEKSTEKLSSGYKINRAADDAAGLSISEKMRKRVRGLNQGASNINDGINYCQVADGALAEVNEMMARMKVLAIKASNGTMSQSDREDVNNEIQHLKDETDRIMKTTKFNERFIWEQNQDTVTELKGTTTTSEVTVSFSNSAPRADIKLTNANKESWPVSSVSETLRGSTSSGFYVSAGYASGTINVSADEANGIQFKWKGLNGKDYASDYIPWPSDPLSGQTLHLKDYLSEEKAKPDYAEGELDYIDAVLSYNTNPGITDMNDLISSLNNISFGTTVHTSDFIELYDSSGNIYRGDGIGGVSATVALTYPAIVYSDRDLDNTADTSFIDPTRAGVISKNNVSAKPAGSGKGTWSNDFSFSFELDNIGTVTAKALSGIYYIKNVNTKNDSDIDRDHVDYYQNGTHPQSRGGDRWWGWGYSTRYNRSTDSYEYIPDRYTGYKYIDKSNIMESVEEALKDSVADTNGYLTGLLDDMDSDGSDNGIIQIAFELTAETAFNFNSNQTNGTKVGSMVLTVGVKENEDRQDVINRILKIDGADIFSASGNNSDSGGPGPDYADIAAYSPIYRKNISKEVFGPVLDENGKPIYSFVDQRVDIHTEDTNSEDVIIPIEYECLNNYVLGIDDMETTSISSARQAIDLVDRAAKKVSGQRSLFGAYQNRLEHAYDINNNTSENTDSAESKIRDTDMATEMVRFSKENILQQAGQSMLAQANGSQQGVLSLLL